MKDKERENNERLCCYCEKAITIREFETYLCKKSGIVSYDFCCTKFAFDPLKKVPARVGKSMGGEFTGEDFSF